MSGGDGRKDCTGTGVSGWDVPSDDAGGGDDDFSLLLQSLLWIVMSRSLFPKRSKTFCCINPQSLSLIN